MAPGKIRAGRKVCQLEVRASTQSPGHASHHQHCPSIKVLCLCSTPQPEQGSNPKLGLNHSGRHSLAVVRRSLREIIARSHQTATSSGGARPSSRLTHARGQLAKSRGQPPRKFCLAAKGTFPSSTSPILCARQQMRDPHMFKTPKTQLQTHAVHNSTRLLFAGQIQLENNHQTLADTKRQLNG